MDAAATTDGEGAGGGAETVGAAVATGAEGAGFVRSGAVPGIGGGARSGPRGRGPVKGGAAGKTMTGTFDSAGLLDVEADRCEPCVRAGVLERMRFCGGAAGNGAAITGGGGGGGTCWTA